MNSPHTRATFLGSAASLLSVAACASPASSILIPGSGGLASPARAHGSRKWSDPNGAIVWFQSTNELCITGKNGHSITLWLQTKPIWENPYNYIEHVYNSKIVAGQSFDPTDPMWGEPGVYQFLNHWLDLTDCANGLVSTLAADKTTKMGTAGVTQDYKLQNTLWAPPFPQQVDTLTAFPETSQRPRIHGPGDSCLTAKLVFAAAIGGVIIAAGASITGVGALALAVAIVTEVAAALDMKDECRM